MGSLQTSVNTSYRICCLFQFGGSQTGGTPGSRSAAWAERPSVAPAHPALPSSINALTRGRADATAYVLRTGSESPHYVVPANPRPSAGSAQSSDLRGVTEEAGNGRR